jgi:RNA polymerase sigma factor for flagellar operon FliA
MYAYQTIEASPADVRERLILEHLPQVRLIARRIHDRLPETVSLEDLISTGIIGLISAIDHFDPTHNVKLKTYAEYKIRGAILDSLRGLDWAPRQRRKRAKQIDSAIARAEQRLQRVPSEDEIAEELNVHVDEYRDWLIEIRGLDLGSLEYVPDNGTGQELLSYISDDEAKLPSCIFERDQLEQLIASSIQNMPDIERTVLSLYYHEELNLREIAEIVGLHTSRISQLKTQAIARLRCTVAKSWPERGA